MKKQASSPVRSTTVKAKTGNATRYFGDNKEKGNGANRWTPQVYGGKK